ncbi:MAG: DUF5702 domain-containing protein [Lachnospiraceae bacterium]|nr:DUF5702 domain-containing protein [Lachnospiraceae bacterium]
MQSRSTVITREALAGTCSEYQPYLWAAYQILALDGSYGSNDFHVGMVENRIGEFCQNNCDGGNGLFHMEPTNCRLKEYCLLTDGDGAVFMQQAAKMAKQQISLEAIQQWHDGVCSMGGDGQYEISAESQVDAAEKALEHPDPSPAQDETENFMDTNQAVVPTFDNPFRIFREIKEKGWLGIVTEGREISQRTIVTDGTVSTRSLQQGTGIFSDIAAGEDKNLWFYEWYLLHRFPYFGQETKGDGLAYQMEYIIAGKSSDIENLETVVCHLLAMRQVENVLTITSNPGMIQQTYQVALSLAGASANPAVVQLVQAGVVAVWALVESILDARRLLDGGRVALVKTAEQWTSQLYSLATYIVPSQKARETDTGMTYVHYLASQLFLLNKKALGLRPMDLMEEDLRRQNGFENARMDHMLCSMEVACAYQSYPIFLSVVGTESFSRNWYSYECEDAIAY